MVFHTSIIWYHSTEMTGITKKKKNVWKLWPPAAAVRVFFSDSEDGLQHNRDQQHGITSQTACPTQAGGSKRFGYAYLFYWKSIKLYECYTPIIKYLDSYFINFYKDNKIGIIAWEMITFTLSPVAHLTCWLVLSHDLMAGSCCMPLNR